MVFGPMPGSLSSSSRSAPPYLASNSSLRAGCRFAAMAWMPAAMLLPIPESRADGRYRTLRSSGRRWFVPPPQPRAGNRDTRKRSAPSISSRSAVCSSSAGDSGIVHSSHSRNSIRRWERESKRRTEDPEGRSRSTPWALCGWIETRRRHKARSSSTQPGSGCAVANGSSRT